MSNVVHDGPLVVHGRPGTATSSHFEDHAAERPDINSAVAAGASAANYFGRHVHGCTGHGALVTLTCGVVFGGEGPTLASDDFCGAEVDKLDYTVVVEENIWVALVRGLRHNIEQGTYSRA